ncbi:carbohydrate esterase family 15 protein [Botryobasidium botryosum FD-172 SS1]|uniref:(4-O-methyl)-D-glucuronate--lignin esterase n=1 Tax=Botryobasidium botryosum (strain FD-172 SS1) TaxID=930990 RepID=A0A067N2B1_BOTB1|nr:carbohydrate esterase family 15 protein [Botryobasidium botryosum FD-172 SS1]
MKTAIGISFLATAIASVGAVPIWGQCGGIGWTGSTACDSGLKCVVCQTVTATTTTPVTTSTPTTTVRPTTSTTQGGSPTNCPALPATFPNGASLPVTATLPDPWTFYGGSKVTSKSQWACRKAELFKLLQEYMYGYYPDHSQETVTATRNGNTLSISVSAGGKTGTFSATITLPTTGQAPYPVVITPGSVDNNAFLSQGVALVSFSVTAVAADSASKTGAFWSVYNGRNIGVLTAWAWGYHRVLDAIILRVPEIDTSRVGVTGCSRYGKGALAAGLFDERITLTLAMSPGLEGVGPWRFFYESGGANEKIENIWGYAPWWVSTRIGEFVNDARKLPFDAHSIAAVIAPRALIWDVGTSDYWTNPEGESAVTFPAAKAVYNWLGASGQVGLATRSGGHCDNAGFTNVQGFMNKIFFGKTPSKNYDSTSPYTAHTETHPWASSPPPA